MPEYKRVLSKSTAPDRIERLEGVGLTPTQTRDLVSKLSSENKVRQPALSFTAQGGGGGTYDFPSMRMTLDSTGTDASTLAHEYAHHLWWLKVMKRKLEDARKTAYHGWEFVWQFDKVAAATERLILASSWYSATT